MQNKAQRGFRELEYNATDYVQESNSRSPLFSKSPFVASTPLSHRLFSGFKILNLHVGKTFAAPRLCVKSKKPQGRKVV
jgi:hypothetical protein